MLGREAAQGRRIWAGGKRMEKTTKMKERNTKINQSRQTGLTCHVEIRDREVGAIARVVG